MCLFLLLPNFKLLGFLFVQVEFLDLLDFQLVLLFGLLDVQTIMNLHSSAQFLASVNLFLVDHSALLVALP